MKIDIYGKTLLNEQEIFQNFYTGNIKILSNIYTDVETAKKFNESKNLNKDNFDNINIYIKTEENIKTFDQKNQQNWFIPKDYCPDLIQQLYKMCITEEQKSRVDTELKLFNQYNMIDLLFYLKYLVDIMRSNNIIWGVGRGSSVASYVLYLIGVHKIDSLKFNLDIREFLK